MPGLVDNDPPLWLNLIGLLLMVSSVLAKFGEGCYLLNARGLNSSDGFWKVAGVLLRIVFISVASTELTFLVNLDFVIFSVRFESF